MLSIYKTYFYSSYVISRIISLVNVKSKRSIFASNFRRATYMTNIANWFSFISLPNQIMGKGEKKLGDKEG